MTLLTHPTEAALEAICDAHWNGGTVFGPAVCGVRFTDIHQHDAVNHTLSGTIEIEGHTYGFEVDNGNWNGTVVRQWVTDPEDLRGYQPPKHEPLTLIPDDPFFTLRTLEVYAYQFKADWFQSKARGYLYDRHFAPGEATERHYRPWMAQKGLRLGTLDELTPRLTTLLKDIGIDRPAGPLTEKELVEAFTSGS